MSDVGWSTRARSIVRNAVVWGVAWGTLGTIVAAFMRASDGIALPMAVLDGIGMGVRIGVVGGIVGVAFSALIAFVYRNRRLSEINPLRFGVVGALLAGVFLPFFLQGMNVLSGDGPVAWSLIAMDIVIAVVFGGLTAWSTMKLAQGAERGGALSGVEDRELLSSPPPDLTVSRRARAHADER